MSFDILPILYSNTLGLALWEGGLFGGLAALALACIVYLKYRLTVIKNEKDGMHQLVNERSELLKYASENEKKAKDNAHHANQEKSLLLARINHEIRTPLNGILGMVALLEETPQTAEQQEYNETIRDCGDTLLQVVNDILYNDILAYSKLESGKMELEKKDFNLESCIEDVLETLARKANHQNVELIYEIAPEVPAQISGDLLRVRQILMNLVENSVKHTTDGEVQISVSLNSSVTTTAPVSLKFEVRDSGTGIDPEKIRSLSSESNGLASANRKGLGLPISKKLIELMGGTFKIESESTKGTCVTFTILATPGLLPTRPVLIPDLAGRKILIVQENIRLANVLKDLMTQWKLLPVMATSGQEAQAILAEQSDIAVLFTDLKIQGMTGIELAQKVNKSHPQLPLILLAPAGNPSLKKHPELFDAVISKPVRRATLKKQISTVLLHSEDETPEVQDSPQRLSENFSVVHPMRLLVAEDNPTNQKLAMKVLGKLGYTPDIAKHGKEVLEIVSHKNYDLILMDVQMPLMDGLEATRMLRLCLSTQPVIIAMTANTLQGDREECMRAGMDDYISKPINLEELVNLLEKWALHINAK